MITEKKLYNNWKLLCLANRKECAKIGRKFRIENKIYSFIYILSIKKYQVWVKNEK